MKKLLLIALSAVLTATVGHAANDDIVVDGVVYEWYAQNNQYGYIATGWDEETPIQSLHIRGKVDGSQVYGIADGAFEDNKDIIYLTIDEGIEYIGQDAFNGCYNIEVAILPEGLMAIEEGAFAYCTSLTEFVVPSTVRNIQARAFMGCTGVADVYFLMTDTAALDEFVWWDGWYQNIFDDYASPDLHGGIEFNRSRLPDAVIENPSQPGETVTIEHNPESGTMVHVPFGMFDSYVASKKLEAWLLEEEAEDECHPLWWIVNYGVVGRQYTVCDDVQGVYVDVEDGLYAKDDEHWLTPDRVYPHEIDFMKGTHLMDALGPYDQSNWVVLRNLDSPDSFISHIITGGTITGTLIDKKNPEIWVTSTPECGQRVNNYQPNIYIPCSFMGRTQLGANEKIYAFVQPKPQEYIKVMWAIYCGDNELNNQFFIPAPDDEGTNSQELAGGVDVDFKLYEGEYVPWLEEGGIYEFTAVNRSKWANEQDKAAGGSKNDYEPIEPNVDGGVSDKFLVFPLELPDEPLPTTITTVVSSEYNLNQWFTIDGRSLGTTKPTVPGLYINGNRKVIIR